ncbi:MAG TPA: GlsB/YeaQ/YmgE family stress response membrane protein [Gemmatimonadaceae bacterium]|nr:GlsB/YeaQ/YmgE family stress response membrane protein [Gemmatimonadaceae bacterium]
MPLVIWLVVGFASGVLAYAFLNGGYGLFGDVVGGMVGAVGGNWLFEALRIYIPLDGLLSHILVAIAGAWILVILLRATRPRRRYAWSR